MNNIWIVLQKEYWIRVRQKTFIIATVLTPLGFLLITFIPALITIFSDDSSKLFVNVIDPNNLVVDKLNDFSSSEILFKGVKDELEKAKKELKEKKDDAILVIPESFDSKNINVTLYSTEAISIQQIKKIKDIFTNHIADLKLVQANVTKEQKEILDFKLDVNTVKILDVGEEKTSAILAAGIGYVMGLLIYMFLLIYGSMVMRGVVEEKANRIMEIIVSTVKPIELMMGKILGIAAVGLTQFSIWIFTIVIFNFIIGFFISPDAININEVDGPTKSEMQNLMNEVYLALSSFRISLIFHFLFYFLGGYILYGSLFAALGAMVDQESDAQQLTYVVVLPVMLPILFIGNIIQSPNGTIATFMSIFPLFSSITMMIRLAATDVPFWQMFLSYVFLFAGVIGIGWLAARIFRVGILLYGKKSSVKEAVKWIFSNQ